jgi:hypothetical protein
MTASRIADRQSSLRHVKGEDALRRRSRARGLTGPRFPGTVPPYRQIVTLFTEALDCLSDIDKTWIMGRGIAEWLGWLLSSGLYT